MSKKSILLLVILIVIFIANVIFLPNAIINSNKKEGLDYTSNRTVVNETNNKEESVTKTDKKDDKKSKKTKKKNKKKKHKTKKSKKHNKNKHKKRHKKRNKTYRRRRNKYSNSGGRVITCLATAYCGCPQCSEGWGTMTATGSHAVSGRTIAVDPSVIPLGSRVVINGHVYVAEDTGGGVKGNHVDIFMDNHSSTYNWGARTVQVRILGR